MAIERFNGDRSKQGWRVMIRNICSYRWYLAGLVAVIALWLSAASLQAHFLLNLNVRIFHVEHVQNGLRVFVRTPMPYLVADKLGDAPDGVLPPPAPFTSNAFQEEVVVHYVDFNSVDADPMGVAQLVADGLILVVSGETVKAEVEALKLFRVGEEPGFATLNEAQTAISSSGFDRSAPLFVGDTVVDVALFFPTQGSVSEYSISSTLDPGLPGQEETANLILDYGPGEPKVFRSRGLMQDPVVVTQSAFGGILTFIWEGVRHILEGVDHVLFVVCLVIGAQTLNALLWRVTGFTIGHSLTLTTGFFGFVPSGAWFVPAVETGIALSIIYAAVVALQRPTAEQSSNRSMLIITIAIGLLHGLGFSFVLQEILQVTSPNIWQSLLAFNVGVEVGQILIVLAVWPFLLALHRLSTTSWSVARLGMAGACVAIAAYWTIERAGMVLSAI